VKSEQEDGWSAGQADLDLSEYTEPVEHYVEMYEQYLAALKKRSMTEAEADLAWSRRVHANYGLIARGAAAIPYALRMLSNKEPDAREDSAGILAELGQRPEVVDHLLQALERETDQPARDSLVLALGQLRAKKAIPVLARIIRDPAADGDTRWSAVESLGLIVRRRFIGKPDPVNAALEWLASHGV
jgi:HEAT repeat protein